MPTPSTDAIEIPKGVRDLLLVFRLDMRPEQVRFLRDEEGALAQVLGVAELNMDHAELVAIDDLEGVGLLGYLREGLGVGEDDLSAYGLALDNLTGHVLLLRARAFDGAATRLTPADQLHLIARLGEVTTDWSAAGPIETDSAKPRPAPSPRDARNRARRIGATLFAVVMALIFLLIYVLVT